MLRTDVQGARYDLTENVDPDQRVAQFIARWVSDKKLDTEPSLVTLRRVSCEGDAPTADEEAEAEVLNPRHTLRAAGVADGGSLLAVFARTRAHAALGPPLVGSAPSTFGKQDCWQAAQFPSDATPPPLLCFTPPHGFPEALPAALVPRVRPLCGPRDRCRAGDGGGRRRRVRAVRCDV